MQKNSDIVLRFLNYTTLLRILCPVLPFEFGIADLT